MTTQAADLDGLAVESGAVTPEPLDSSLRNRILLYLGALILLIGFGPIYGGLFDTPIRYILKNKLHLSPTQVAIFELAAAIPLYFSFISGFLVDTWRPFGIRNRGFMILFGAATTALYALFAFVHVTYLSLLVGVVLITATFQFAVGAQSRLSSMMGRQHVMSGQVAAVWNIFQSVPTLIVFFAGGQLSNYLEKLPLAAAARVLFLIGAGLLAVFTLYTLWRPGFVYDHLTPEESKPQALKDIGRLARHWPIYPALLIWLLWNFAPGSVTPLQYYLQNTLRADDAAYGNWNAIFSGMFIPTFMLFGVLCRKVPLRTLLFWGTVAAVPQMVPLLFLKSVGGALVGAAFCGLMGGVATAAYYDLMIRSSPKGLEGTVLMLSVSLYWIASRFGDILGSNLYQHYGGFTVCVIAITVVYALILPALLLVPKRLVATADGEVPPDPADEVFG